MLRFDGRVDMDRLWANIYPSTMGGVILEIYVQRQDQSLPDLVHLGNYDSEENAEKDMRHLFKNVNWR